MRVGNFYFKPMLTLSQLRDEKPRVLSGLAKRGPQWAQAVENALTLDQQRRAAQHELDQCLAKSRAMANEIGALLKAGKKAEAEEAKAAVANIKQEAAKLESKLSESDRELTALLHTIPNVPHESVANGRSADDNEVVRTWGNAENTARNTPHWELCKQFNLVDFELGVKISGAGFPVYRGKGAKLQRALIQFFLREAERAGYEEIMPPLLVNADSGFGTGQLPDKDGQMYFAPADELYLIPTAEVPITNLLRDTVLDASQLPVKMAGYTPCFRREAGSYGKDVRGLNRLHQFDKVEIVQAAHPQNSYEALETMVAHVEGLLQKLQLPHRVLRLCGGDMGFTSALTYDLEVYSQGQGRWLEVSSVSNFETYQSNRLKLRVKDIEGTRYLAHTLNGSALALPRVMAALLENNFDGQHVHLPECIAELAGFSSI